MPLRRALLLQQMGIKQWVLHQPQALKGAAAIFVAAHIKLLIISENTLLPTTLLHDIYHALGIQADNSLIINAEQFTRLRTNHSLIIWQASEPLSMASQPLHALTEQGSSLISLNWQTLQQSAEAKRHLWQQLQQFQFRENNHD